MSVKFTGMKELQRKLKELERIGERITEKALQAGAEILRAEIARRAPKSTYNKQHLADHIIISEILDGRLDVGYDKDFFYAKYLELGTSKMSKQPFIEPAFHAVKDDIQKAMVRVIRQELAKL